VSDDQIEESLESDPCDATCLRDLGTSSSEASRSSMARQGGETDGLSEDASARRNAESVGDLDYGSGERRERLALEVPITRNASVTAGVTRSRPG
jgi:hypothetical protein